MAVGVWTLVEKSGYLGVLASSTFAASAYILIFAGALVTATGCLGFGAIIREQKSCLSTVSATLHLLGRGRGEAHPCCACIPHQGGEGSRVWESDPRWLLWAVAFPVPQPHTPTVFLPWWILAQRCPLLGPADAPPQVCVKGHRDSVRTSKLQHSFLVFFFN